MNIPIQNIYYLLCYAWDKLEEGEKVNVDQDDYDSLIDLLGRLLVKGCKHLFKRGLEHNYNNITKEYLGIKGKIDFTASLNKNLFKQGRAICNFDEFEVNVLSNQLIKATLRQLIKIKALDEKIKKEVWFYYTKFPQVDDIEISPSVFLKVRIHRNNSFYDFILRICQLIIENCVVDESDGTYKFKDFLRNEKQMASLFESFIRNFYKKEQREFNVIREDIYWDAIPLEGSQKSFLPKMQTDITLESNERKIIIETKYYKEALIARFEGQKFHSNNLYQLYSYLRNLESKTSHIKNSDSDGILLYPVVGYSLNEAYLMGNHQISIKTVDLSRKWNEIHTQLLNVVA